MQCTLTLYLSPPDLWCCSGGKCCDPFLHYPRMHVLLGKTRGREHQRPSNLDSKSLTQIG